MDDIPPIARELRLARESAGLTREQAAEIIGYTVSMIEKVETGKANASVSYVTAAMKHFPPDPGILDRVRQDGMRRPVVSEWLKDYLDIEGQAAHIRWFEPWLIPGLLQTEGYARALLRDEDKVRVRMERRVVFTRDTPPDVVVIIEASVLRYLVGSPAVMSEQLMYLVDAPAVVYVMPSEANAHHLGRDGSFVLATVGDRTYIYVATPARGFTLEDHELVSDVRLRWEALLAESLPQALSRELIIKEAERWKSET